MFKLGFGLAMGYFVAKRIDTMFENTIKAVDKTMRQYVRENNPELYDTLVKLNVCKDERRPNYKDYKRKVKIGFDVNS